MITGDVASLYTNIDNKGAMDAVRWALENDDNRTDEGLCIFILKCLEFCLQNNFSGMITNFICKLRVSLWALNSPLV